MSKPPLNVVLCRLGHFEFYHTVSRLSRRILSFRKLFLHLMEKLLQTGHFCVTMEMVRKEVLYNVGKHGSTNQRAS